MPEAVCIWYNACPLKKFFEQGRLSKAWIEGYCRSDYVKCLRKKNADNGIPNPDNMLPDGSIDKNLQ
jgi:hypothetical protein